MTIEVVIVSQCVPIGHQIDAVRTPLHQVALALYEKGKVRPYEISQSLDSLSSFWERFDRGDASLSDFEDDFNGDKYRARKKAQAWLEAAIARLEPGDTCPLCKIAHVAIDKDENIVCVGECGVVRAAPPAETEPEGSQQEDEDAEEGSGDPDAGDRKQGEGADQEPR